MSEYAQALAEVQRIADERDVDLVLVSGDVFDRPVPPMEALGLALRSLVDLAKSRPVVVVAGNHDSPDLFETLAPLLARENVHMVGTIKAPDEGGVLGPDELGIDAVVGCFPFLREARVVDFMAETGSWYGQYADRIRAICEAYSKVMVERAGNSAVPLLVAHFMVTGVKIGGHGQPRGERDLHIGQSYSATEHALPPGPQYVAMGHIHAPQAVPGAPVPARYAGSLLPLDFGEAGEQKSVVIIDAQPGLPAKVETVDLEVGRPLVRAHGTWEHLSAREDLRDAYLDLSITTPGPDPGLADTAHEAFPFVVKVRPDYPRPEAEQRRSRQGRTLVDLYSEYVSAAGGEPADEETLAELRDILEEVNAATP
jgi:exonuclease SbcD